MIKRIAPMLLLLAFLPLQLHAQQTGASVTGHVIDPSGAAIVRGHHQIDRQPHGGRFTRRCSDSAGIYQFPLY